MGRQGRVFETQRVNGCKNRQNAVYQHHLHTLLNRLGIPARCTMCRFMAMIACDERCIVVRKRHLRMLVNRWGCCAYRLQTKEWHRL